LMHLVRTDIVDVDHKDRGCKNSLSDRSVC
jgi:hypothetical protein